MRLLACRRRRHRS